LAIAIELAQQSVAVFGSQLSQMSDELLDALPARLPYVIGAAELSGVLLHLPGIETMLAYQQKS
jgi:hypothetical protein